MIPNFFGLVVLAIVAAGGLFPTLVQAQNLEFGVRGGYARSNEFTTDVTICVADRCGPTTINPHFWRSAPTAGMVLRWDGGARLALRAEAALAPKGYGPGDERSDWRVHSRYLELPLLADVRLLRIGPAHLQLSGGVVPAVLLACDVSGTTVDGFVAARCTDRDPFTGNRFGPNTPYDLGWAVAPGLRLPVGSGAALLEFRHTRGLVDIRPDAVGHTANRSTAVSVATTWQVR